MLTLKTVNKKIASLGINAELIKGDGYFYFWGKDVELCRSTSVMVNQLNCLSIDQWMEELKGFVKCQNM